MDQNMVNLFILPGGIVPFVTIVGILDIIGSRKKRQSRDRAA